MAVSNHYLPAQGEVRFPERGGAPAPLRNSANTIHRTVSKIFTAIAALALAATIYTAFWFTAAPATVIAAFNTSATIFVISSIIALVARWLQPNPQVDQDHPAPPVSHTLRPSAPPAAAVDTRAPSAPPQPEPAEGSAEHQYQETMKLYRERCTKIKAEYESRLENAAQVRDQALLDLQPTQALIQQYKDLTGGLSNAQAQINRLHLVTPPNPQEIASTRAALHSVKQEILRKSHQLHPLARNLNLNKHLYAKSLECQSLNKEAIEKEIADSKQPVTGIRAAWGARSKGKEAEDQLAFLNDYGHIPPAVFKKEIDSLTPKVQELELQISPLKRQAGQLALTVQAYAREQEDYNTLLQARAKKERLTGEIRDFQEAHGNLSGLEALCASQREAIQHRYLQAKAELVAWRDEALANERKPLAPLDASVD